MLSSEQRGGGRLQCGGAVVSVESPQQSHRVIVSMNNEWNVCLLDKMCTCRTLDTGWVKEVVAQWGGGEEAKERQIEMQSKRLARVWIVKGARETAGSSEYFVTSQTTASGLRGWGGWAGAAEAVSEGTRKIHFSETKHVFCLNRLGKNFIPDQFSFLVVKEGRRRKKSQREEHGRRKRKRKEIGHVTKVNTEHLVTSRTTCEA